MTAKATKLERYNAIALACALSLAIVFGFFAGGVFVLKNRDMVCHVV